MNKINFQNLPNETTPINATNLNTMQQNIENAINSKSSLPVGGDEGQILAKASNQDNDVEWIDNIGQGGGDTLPIGAIVPFGGDTIPNGWLLCDGRTVSRETYSELFAVLGETCGEGDGTTTFNLPDMRRKVTVGKDSNDTDFDTLGETGGGTAQENLRVSAVTYGSSESQIYRGQTLISKNRNETSGAVTIDNCDLDLMPPYVVTNFIIKAKQKPNILAIEDSLPLGTILDYDGNTVPEGYVEVDENEKILWTNPNPTDDFDPQTITLSSSDYDILEWYFNGNVQSSTALPCDSNRSIKGYGTRLNSIVSNTMTYREIARNSDTSFSVGAGYSGADIQNRRCVPLYVVGIKNGLFTNNYVNPGSAEVGGQN